MPRRLRDLAGPRITPVFGNSLQIKPRQMHLQLEQWARQFGPFYRIALLNKPVLVVSDAATIHKVLQARPDDFRRFSPMEPVFREMGAHGLFLAEGATWRQQRRLVMPAFSMRQQRELLPSISLYTERLRHQWLAAAQRGAAVDVQDDLMRYIVDVTAKIVFGDDLGTLERADSEFQRQLVCLFSAGQRRMLSPVPYWRWFKLKKDRELDTALSFIHELLNARVREARAQLEADPSRVDSPTTLLEAMLAAQRSGAADGVEGQEPWSDEDVTGNLITLLLAAEDTTANTLAWMMHYAAHDKTIQHKLHQESSRVLGPAATLPRYEDAAKLRYASAVASETLRMRSAGPVLFLDAAKDVTLSGIDVPKGTSVFLLTRYVGMQPENFDNPLTFMPERWLVAGGPAQDARNVLAFGGGPRVCPGRSLALFECALVMSMVAQTFELEPIGRADAVGEALDFAMGPQGIRIRFRAREAVA